MEHELTVLLPRYDKNLMLSKEHLFIYLVFALMRSFGALVHSYTCSRDVRLHV